MAKPKKQFNAYVKQHGSELLPQELQHLSDHLNLFQHRVLSRRWTWQTCESKVGNVTPLKREYINEELGKENAKELLAWGKESGIIVCDDHYVMGEKSYGYRLHEDVEKLKIKRIVLVDEDLNDRLFSMQRREYNKYTKAHRHLLSWYKKVTIESSVVQDMLGWELDAVQRESIDGVVRSILDGSATEDTFKRCPYGRLHSLITRLFKRCRGYLRLDGLPLVSIDVGNSQPLFIAISLLMQTSKTRLPSASPSESSPLLYDGRESSSVGFNSQQIQALTNKSNLPKTEGMSEDVKQYLATCQEGKLYGQLMEKIGWTRGKDSFKSDLWFQFLYGKIPSSGYLRQDGMEDMGKLIHAFESMYPNVYSYMKSQKQPDYEKFSQNMQKAESKLMIDGVCFELAEKYPHVPLLTIHDSIMTTQPYVDLVKEIMASHFAQLGVSPTLNEETY